MGEGVSYIAQTYNKANKKYMKYYDKHKSYKCTIYKDGRWTITKYLSVDEFKLLTRDKMDEFHENVVR